MTSSLHEFGSDLVAALPEQVKSASVAHGELTLAVTVENLVSITRYLRDDQHCQFKLLMDITAVDWPERAERFDVVYNLLSLTYNRRVRLKVAVAEGVPLPTISRVFSTANWLEREVWDMFGIPFADHPDLRRILTDYGFDGHPLRKDFPLTGHVEVRYDDELKRVVYQPVTLPQEFRRFDFISPWEGMAQLFPGDEKSGGGQSK